MVPPAMTGEIQSAYERCQRRYPTIALPAEDFLSRALESGVSFDKLHHEDLYIAIACAHGDRIAWEYFADDYLPLLRRLAAQACRQFQESDDLAQEIVAGLIAEKKKLGGYDGRGSLASWLRVAVARAAIDRFRRVRREVSLEETVEHGREPTTIAIDHGRQPESLDARWGPVLAGILKSEIDHLPARDRLLLGLYYLNEVPLKKIGLRFGVHEATVSRWLDRLRNRLRKSTESQLSSRYGLRSKDLDSLWGWVAGGGTFSLTEILKPREAPPPSAEIGPMLDDLANRGDSDL